MAMRSLVQSVIQVGLSAQAAHDQNSQTRQILGNLSAQVQSIVQQSSSTIHSLTTASRNSVVTGRLGSTRLLAAYTQ